MKVTIFSPTVDPTNGYGNITLELCRRLQKLVDLTLLLPYNERNHIVLTKTRVLKVLPSFIFNFKDKRVIEYLLWKQPMLKSDLIHSLFAFPYALLASQMALRMAKPLIVGAQGTYGVEPLTHQPEKFFLKRAYKNAAAIHVPSEFTKKNIERFSETRTSIKVIPNGVNYDRFQNKQMLSALKLRYGKGPILLGVGGLKRRKGFDISIRAVARLVSKFPGIKYLIVGEGDRKDELGRLISELDLSENVFLLGNKSGDELVSLFQFCDLYLHTPRIDGWNFEGFGIVYLEAASCGKPVVASRSGGVGSAVKHNQTGLLVREGSIGGTTVAIENLLTDRNLYLTTVKNSRIWARGHDWDMITKKFMRLYKDYG